MIVKKVTFSDFLDEFEKYGREDQYSYEAKKALYDYLNDLSDDIGQPIELDIISICCDFTEYRSLQEFNADYGYSVGEVNSVDEIEYSVIKIDEKSFIIRNF